MCSTPRRHVVGCPGITTIAGERAQTWALVVLCGVWRVGCGDANDGEINNVSGGWGLSELAPL